MFNFFKRSKSQKSKQKQQQKLQQQTQCDATASKDATPSACVTTSPLEVPTTTTTPPSLQFDRDGVARRSSDSGRNDNAKVISSAENSGNGREGESVINKQHPPPSATSFSFSTSPNDIIRENGRSFDFEDGTGSVIEFADDGVSSDENDDEDEEDEPGAINESESSREAALNLPVLHVVLGEEASRPKSEQSTSYNQNANLLESAMAKGKNKRRNQQNQNGKNFNQQQQQQQQGQKQNNYQQSNKDNHLLLKEPLEKSNKVGVENVSANIFTPGVTWHAENVTKVQQIDDKVNGSEDNCYKEEQKEVQSVSKDGDYEVRPCLMASDVNGNNVEVHECKNSIVVRSDMIIPSAENDQHDRCSDATAGVSTSVTTEDKLITTPPVQTQSKPVTSPFPLTQTTADEWRRGRNGSEDELLKNGSSVPPYPVSELHSSASSASSREIKDGTRELSNSSESVTSKDVTSNEEMGQTPGKPADPTNSSRRSSTPNRQPTPITVNQQQQPVQQHLTIQIKQDASRDDISDDLFYEATESISPTPTSPPASSVGDSATAVPFSSKEEKPTAQSGALVKEAEPRASPKKRVVFSDQLLVNGKLTQESDLRNCSASANSEESLPCAINLEPPQCNYDHNSVVKTNDEPVHAVSSPESCVFSNNGVIEELNVCKNEQSAFTSDKHGISSSVSTIIANKPKLIEFKYDHSDSSAHHDEEGKGEEYAKTNGEKESTPVITALENGSTTLIVEEIISLPDVVQPTSIDKQPFNTVDKINSEMKELVNQESRYSAKLEDAEKRASEAQTKVYELQLRLEEVERDVSLKECNVDRLQAELDAACKECESIHARMRTQTTEMDALRLNFSEKEDELNLKYQNLEVELLELNEKLKEVRECARDLNIQLIDAKSVAESLQKEKDKLLEERAEEQKIIKEALDMALKERGQLDAKWKSDFEQLRTVHSDREEHLMEDCEWKIRSMQKNCKEKLEAVERERKVAMDKVVRLEQDNRKHQDEAKHLRSYEAEVAQLRGLTYDQKEALKTMTRQVDQLKADLEAANNKLEEEIVKVQQIKHRCEYQLCEKEREALNRIEIARGEIAMQWEDRLLHEMNRLKTELEQMHVEERISAINKIKKEALDETEALTQKFNMRERQLKEEIESLKATIQRQRQAMEDAQTEADHKLLQSRMFVERAEREHEAILEKEVSKRDEIIENLKERYEVEKHDMEQHFSVRIQQIQDEFARELSDTTELLKMAHKKELEKQWKQLVNEKEEALQLMESRQRTRLEEAESKIRELMINHQRQLKDLHDENQFEITSLEARDTKNAQEIQTLHKKCRCLTNLFEEMRIRYERRDPRPEDLQQIEELKSVVEAQDRDLRLLTEQFREMQLHEKELQQRLMQQKQSQAPQPPKRAKNRGKQQQQQSSQQNDFTIAEDQQQQQLLLEQEEELLQQQPPQIQIQPKHTPVPIVCDVIYEENEADLMKEEQGEQPDQTEQIVVVDVPESAIQTETTVIQSTEPVFIDSPPASPATVPTETEQETQSPVEEPSAPVPEQLHEQPQEQPIPVIQIDHVSDSESSEPETVVISEVEPNPTIVTSEEPSAEPEPDAAAEVSVSTIIEIPIPSTKQPEPFQPPAEREPSPSPAEKQQQKQVQNMPEMIVIRVPDVVAQAVAVADAAIAVETAAATTAADVFVCAPGPRSSST